MIITTKQKKKAFKNLVVIGKTICADDPEKVEGAIMALANLCDQIGGVGMMHAFGIAVWGNNDETDKAKQEHCKGIDNA